MRAGPGSASAAATARTQGRPRGRGARPPGRSGSLCRRGTRTPPGPRARMLRAPDKPWRARSPVRLGRRAGGSLPRSGGIPRPGSPAGCAVAYGYCASALGLPSPAAAYRSENLSHFAQRLYGLGAWSSTEVDGKERMATAGTGRAAVRKRCARSGAGSPCRIRRPACSPRYPGRATVRSGLMRRAVRRAIPKKKTRARMEALASPVLPLRQPSRPPPWPCGFASPDCSGFARSEV